MSNGDFPEGCFTFLFGAAVVIGLIYFTFTVIIPAIFRGLAILFTNFNFAIIVTVFFATLACFNIKKVEVDINPKIDSANKRLEGSLQDLEKIEIKPINNNHQ